MNAAHPVTSARMRGDGIGHTPASSTARGSGRRSVPHSTRTPAVARPSCAPPMSDDAAYVIQTGASARDRLELIARLCWPTSEAFLERSGAFDAARFIDVGCGIGDVAARLAVR